MRHLLIALMATIIAMATSACIEDGYATSPSAQPEFSVDTLKMGMFFTDDVTPTFAFLVYNRNNKIITISDVTLRDGGCGVFRLNVDGMSGKTFSNIDIRPNDSIYVFVEARIPSNGSPQAAVIEDKLDFMVNGVMSTVVLHAVGQDVERRRNVVIEHDTTWGAEYPYQIFDTLVVAPGATLTLEAGTKLYFHDKASIRVDGRLVTLGTPERPVEMSGDRTDNVVGSIPFDLMSNQWDGVMFTKSSGGSRLSHTVIRNTVWGVVVDTVPSRDGVPGLTMLNCRLRNTGGSALLSIHSDVTSIGCELADAAGAVVDICGGNVRFNHCTIANYYLFASYGIPALWLSHINEDTADLSGLPYMTADFSNCIIYGSGTDLGQGDLTGTSVYLRYCLLKSAGTDDDNFINCLWDSDPLYYTVRLDYIFDYRLRDESPAIGAASAALTDASAALDYYGLPRGDKPDLGAYVYVPSAQAE